MRTTRTRARSSTANCSLDGAKKAPRSPRPHAVSSFYPDAVFYVYVLRSESDSGFYIGFSTNLRARLRQHQNGESFATSHRGPWKLIYYEAYTEREDAEGREKFLKSGAGRRFLRTQLRHYLRVKGFASRGFNHDA